MSCWVCPKWMFRYRTLINSGGYTVESGMNDPSEYSRIGNQVKQQVALLIRLRDAGELKHTKADE